MATKLSGHDGHKTNAYQRKNKNKERRKWWETEKRGWKKSEGKTVAKRDEDRNMGKEGETETKINQATIYDN
jgi:hypothetical protein